MRKYLHVEIMDGALYVYVDKQKRGKTLTLEELDSECYIRDISVYDRGSTIVKNGIFTIDLLDMAKRITSEKS